MKNSVKLITCACFLFVWISCMQPPETMKRTMEQAGDNRTELQKALEHYLQPEDSLKYKAALFLFEHMWVHYSLESEELKRYNRIFDIADTVSTYQADGRFFFNTDKFIAITDSIRSLDGSPGLNTARPKYDSQYITANFILQNIEWAFKAWQENEWARNVSFADFCEYILPYHLHHEPVEAWRPYFYSKYTQIGKASGSNNLSDVTKSIIGSGIGFILWNFDSYYSYPMRLSNIQKTRMASCFQTGVAKVMALRSAGVPVSFDFVPSWGNYGGSHGFVRIIGDTLPGRLTNENLAINSNLIVDASGFSRRPVDIPPHEMPHELTVQYLKTVPKVYRYTWSVQPDRMEIIRVSGKDELLPYFGLYEKDVTDEYLECGNAVVQVDDRMSSSKVIYLCVFSNREWKPVAISPVDKTRQAHFKKLGKNILYLPCAYQNSRFHVLGNPFYLDMQGIKQEVIAGKETHQVSLLSKYPLFYYTADYAIRLKGGQFQGANRKDFKDAETLYEIKDYPFYMHKIEVYPSKAYRHYRYIGDPAQWARFAEFKFYGIEQQDTVPLKGVYYDATNRDSVAFQKLWDSDMETYYENRLNWIALELKQKRRVTKIEFAPRNDANGIEPGFDYELFYWDEEWISLGVKRATDFRLQYDNVPQGALLWLRCLTKGREERIFTYEDGKQMWW